MQPVGRVVRQPAAVWCAMVLQATRAEAGPLTGLRHRLSVGMAARESNIAVDGAGRRRQPNQKRCAICPDGWLRCWRIHSTHWRTNARLLQVMIGWVAGATTSRGAMPPTTQPVSYDVLMHQRKFAWRETLLALLPGRYVAAVGALHLYGEVESPDMLT